MVIFAQGKENASLYTLDRVDMGTAGSARASTWAEGMFEEFSFDFGAVPRGQLVRHPFRIVNNTKETVRIGNIRVTCGCTEAWALQYTLAPGQETAIIAQMNTAAQASTVCGR